MHVGAALEPHELKLALLFGIRKQLRADLCLTKACFGSCAILHGINVDSTWKLSIRASWRVRSRARVERLQMVLKLFITLHFRPKVPSARRPIAKILPK